MKKCFLVLSAFLCIVFSSCDFNDSDSKKTVNIEIDSKSGDRIWFMAASLDSRDIAASDVPCFDFASARSVSCDSSKNKIDNLNISSNLIRYDENISKKNQEIIKNLVYKNNSRTAAYNAVAKIFNPNVSVSEVTEIGLYNGNSDFNIETAEKKYSGTYCNVFFVDNTSGKIAVSSAILENLGNLFDKMIFPYITDILGDFKYTPMYTNVISSPKKVNIVVADLYYDYKETEIEKAGIQGYFSSSDMLTDYKNQDAIIYIDSWFLRENPESVYSTLAHEFNHMLNYINKSFSKKLFFETWYTEMLSALADAMFEEYLAEDLKEENSIYMQRLPFFNTFYNLGFSNWRSETNKYFITNSYGSDVYISYGNVFAFGDFLAKNYGGFDLIKEIATNDYVNEESVLIAVRKVQKNPNITFEDIIKDFSCVAVSNLFNDDSLPTLNKKVVYSGNKNIYLKAVKTSACYKTSDRSNSALDILENNADSVVLGQYGFLIYEYSDSVISEINATVDKDYDAFAYTVLGKRNSI